MNGPARVQRLRAVPLDRVLDRAGAQPDLRDPRKWRTERGVLSVTGSKFMNWSLGSGGGGAIDLAMHLCHLSFGQALDWLEALDNPGAVPFQEPPSPPPTQTLILPTAAPSNRVWVEAYLTRVRRLPRALLEPLFHAGTLYPDAKANAVFLLRGPRNQPVGAELRGTHYPSPWRGMARGSRKDRGFFSIPEHPLQGIILCESAIDAISCHALHPRYRCLSTSGARPDPAWLEELLGQGVPIHCGFDLDPVGEAMAIRLIERHPGVQRLRPTRKDWNDVLRLGP